MAVSGAQISRRFSIFFNMALARCGREYRRAWQLMPGGQTAGCAKKADADCWRGASWSICLNPKLRCSSSPSCRNLLNIRDEPMRVSRAAGAGRPWFMAVPPSSCSCLRVARWHKAREPCDFTAKGDAGSSKGSFARLSVEWVCGWSVCRAAEKFIEDPNLFGAARCLGEKRA